jgi:hypothetical protein
MTDVLDLARFRESPDEFIERWLINPETNQPFVLLDAEKDFLQHALHLTPEGRLLYPELLYGAIKKSGKTGFAALFVITLLLLFGGRYAEGYVAANDLEQAQARVFEAIRRIIEVSPLLRREANITQNKITFPATGSTITCLTGNYASAAGGHPTISTCDEMWAYTSERSRRLYDELVPVPTKQISCRLITTYAGFSGEGQMLEELYNRGMQQPELGPNLHGGDGLLMAWHHEPIAPWQTPEWMEECRRSLRPNQYARMIENRFVTSESNFIELSAWDRCVNKNIGAIHGDRAPTSASTPAISTTAPPSSSPTTTRRPSKCVWFGIASSSLLPISRSISNRQSSVRYTTCISAFSFGVSGTTPGKCKRARSASPKQDCA